MRILRNMKIGQRIQLIVVPSLAILFVLAGLILNFMSKRRALETAKHQAGVYIDRTIQILDIVERQTGPGLTPDDRALLKPYFQRPAYYTSDFPAIISPSGEYLVHPISEGRHLPLPALRQLRTAADGQGCLTYSDFVETSAEELLLCFRYYEPYNAYVVLSSSLSEVLAPLAAIRSALALIIALSVAAVAFSARFVLRPILRNINHVGAMLRQLSSGDIPRHLRISSTDEAGAMIDSLNTLIDGLKRTTEFAREIGNNRLDYPYTPLGGKDELGNALLEMRNSLKKANEEEVRRKQEDDVRTWVNTGLAKFGDILRQNNNSLTRLADSVIQNLVDYLEANQGGIFIYTETDTDRRLELLSAFAYNRKKFITKEIRLGEGLVGTCALERKTIYLKEIPEGYIAITSGLGEATPTSLLLVPLKLEDNIFGVLEMASFKEFPPYQVEFVEKIGESIASTLFAVKNGIRTKALLEQSQQQREEMAAQEEEMRQNMEEMQATQEEMSRKNVELEVLTKAINQALLAVTLSEDGRVLEANANFQHLVGLPMLELDGRLFLDLTHPEQRKSLDTLWAQVLAGQMVSETIRLVGSRGQERYIMASVSPGIDDAGTVVKILLIGQDVSEAKRLEVMAQSQSEKIEQAITELKREQDASARREMDMEALHRALDQNFLVTILNPDGLISYINSRNVEVLGDAKEEIEGKYLHDIDLAARSNPEEFKLFWGNLHRGIKQSRRFSLRVGGKVVWVLENYSPVMDSNGELYKVINIGIVLDDAK